jgi:D-alanyl-D-alanine carboxypeptidase/D-alanyl-D-alanine-endopeptidase (penicillin-binding protein 4)
LVVERAGVGGASRWRRAVGVTLLAAAGLLSPEASAVSQVELERLLSTGPLAKADVAALAVRVRDGHVLHARDPDRALIPASNMKLLTALACLDAFGATHRFETLIHADRAIDPGGGVAWLSVRGGGDPVLNSEDWWRLAADLRRSGLRRIEGDIFVDDTAFDSQYWHTDWGPVSARAYHAPVSALTANYGAYFVSVRPGAAAGDPVRVDVDPPMAYLRLTNRATTASREDRPNLSVRHGEPMLDRETVLVTGVVRAGDEPDVFPRSIRDPAMYAGNVLRMQLEAVGIVVTGKVRRSEARRQGELLLAFEGRPLSEIVRLFVKYSNNAIAETLLKALGARVSGAQGTWDRGLDALRQRLAALGLELEGQVITDGSGLSTSNRLSPRTLVETLRIADESFGFGPELLVALPIANRDGTLDKRLAQASGRVRAKTGLLSDRRVVALSGHIELTGGDRARFAILVNGYRGGSMDAMRAVDRWVAALSNGGR